ncbi:SNT2 [Candida pseudojiufengensis]|uniref:SNT2 n=1 Tax=Candida pseudojiufengensis TaxID=497109 RepID=UPI002225739B|nr:SNT2 [Candida pseudojiufengensis]KAI5965933.1 SNT2 [Candida pseudojiufengensis]
MKLTSQQINDAPIILNVEKKLTLILRNLDITEIDNLQITRNKFQVIDLTNNDLISLSNVPKNFDNLETLLLGNNNIAYIDEEYLPSDNSIKSISLMNNNLYRFQQCFSSKFQKLENLILIGNPITQLDNYRLFLIWLIPSLKVLDLEKVKQKEKDESEKLYGVNRIEMGSKAKRMFDKHQISSNDITKEEKQLNQVVKKLSEEDRKELLMKLQSCDSIEEIERIEATLKEGVKMSSNARPKRKATINKTYDDSLELAKLEDISESNGKKASSLPKKKENIKNWQDNITTNGSTNVVPYNWQPPQTAQDQFSNRLDLTGATINLKKMTLKCKYKNGKSLTLSKGQCIYMISEPPGEPYYIGRIRGFTNKRNHKYEEIEVDNKEDKMLPAEGYFFIINWFYRPRDITKNSADSRLLFATMDSDVCPLSSFRGLVSVELKQDIEDSYAAKSRKQLSPGISPTEAYAQSPNCFYFDKLYDRYMIRSYDVLSTKNLLQYAKKDSKSRHYLMALNKRFSYIFCESTRTKSLINSFKSDNSTCFTCGLWSDHNDSISCFECKKIFHMLCLDPPLLKKPSRGFSWTCASCTKRHEIEYHQKKILMLSHDNKSSNQESLADELALLSSLEADVKIADESTGAETILPKYEVMAKDFLTNDAGVSFEERRVKEEWCMRYLGLNAKLEEGVDLDDRSPYPRASTRIGAKHQAVYIPECNGHPIVYYDTEKIPKKKSKPKPKEKAEEIVKLEVPKEFEDIEVKDYPEWLQPRPKGYIERGVDDGNGTTCTLLWKTSQSDIDDNFEHLDKFITTCDVVAESLNLSPNSPNFVDAVVLSYMKNHGDIDKAFKEVQNLNKKKLNEPVFTRDEIKKFEAGVKEFGNELYHVQKKVKSQPLTQVVRFYYLWKKTKNGKQIWGNYEGRAPKKSHASTKEENGNKSHNVDDLTNLEDDSSYEDDEKVTSGTQFICKHCDASYSTQWFKITGSHDANTESDSVVALCFRCAKLWRRYAVVWQDADETQKKASKSNGWKKRVEPELLQDSNLILEHALSLGASVTYDPKLVIQPTTAKPSPEKKENNKRKAVSSSPTESPTPKVKKVKSETKVEKKEKPTKQEIKTQIVQKLHEVVGSSLGQHTKSLLFNSNYDIPNFYGLSKKLTYTEATEQLAPFFNHYRELQLGDVSSPLTHSQTPHLTSIELPFKPHDRKCCVCREHDTSRASLQEMLICSSCGVNVHASCAAYTLHEKESTKEWLCEPCVNDLRPIHSAIYSCSLCMANETNYELSILGSPYVRPDFLKPTSNGTWCHLLCCIFNSEFIHVSKTKLNNNILSIDNVSKIYLRNHNQKCEICQSYNGSLIKCSLCNDHCYYHPTCAQDTPNYKLGFKLETGTKAPQNVIVNEKIGKLKPILICPEHDQSSETILNFRTLGKRIGSRDTELKPIVKLFYEDLLKLNKSQFSGPLARSLDFVNNNNSYYNLDQASNVKITSNGSSKTCAHCFTDSSPMWWPENSGFFCQSCHYKVEDPETENEENSVEELLSAPLNGENYGIKDQKDSLKNVYKPQIIDESSFATPMVDSVRSKISIVDILT